MDRNTYQTILRALKKESMHCPHCQSPQVVRFGKYRNRQRYRCKECDRTFNELTNTPLHWIHFPLSFMKFLECMIKGYSLHRAALSVGIKVNTAFYWRHKIIKALERVELHQNTPIVDLNKITFQWKCPSINFQIRIPIPLTCIAPQERENFKSWMSFYQWISVKYLNRYIAWFRFLINKPIQPMLDSMRDLLQLSSSIKSDQNYTSLRESV